VAAPAAEAATSGLTVQAFRDKQGEDYEREKAYPIHVSLPEPAK
jgi:hypothetical protein